MVCVCAKPDPRCLTTAFFPLATRDESTGFIIIKVLCEMLWAQLPVFSLFQLSIGVHALMLWSYFKLHLCGRWVFHASSSSLDSACLLPVMHRGSLNEAFFPNCGGRTAESCGRDDFLESTYSAAQLYQCFVRLNRDKLNRTED